MLAAGQEGTMSLKQVSQPQAAPVQQIALWRNAFIGSPSKSIGAPDIADAINHVRP